jgi:hypothetical protein
VREKPDKRALYGADYISSKTCVNSRKDNRWSSLLASRHVTMCSLGSGRVATLCSRDKAGELF